MTNKGVTELVVKEVGKCGSLMGFVKIKVVTNLKKVSININEHCMFTKRSFTTRGGATIHKFL